MAGADRPRPSAQLEEAIGYHFRDPALLSEALTHKSYASESRCGVCNERLEFLGDSVLAAVVAHQLYADHPGESEGVLSKKKSQLVSRPTLAQWAAGLELGAYLKLGVGEASSGGRMRASVLGNALEALIGAIYLDGGFSAAEAFIRRWCRERQAALTETDYKSRLQETLQKKYKSPPTYELESAVGPDHDRVFKVAVRMGRRVLGRGEGKNKKEAEQAAAKSAWEGLSEEKTHGL